MTRARPILVVSCLALATVVSAVAALNVAIPEIARDTGATQTQLSWIIDAYALVFAALLLPGGAIGDRYGRRNALLGGLIIFGGAAAVAMLVDSPELLIVLRGILGLGAALVMPATLSTITSCLEDDQRTRGVAIWSGVAGASAILGLLFSGAVLEVWSWQSVFALNLVLSIISLYGVLRVIPESSDPAQAATDPAGVGLSVVGLGALVYAIIEAPRRGWASGPVLVSGAVGLALVGAFVWWELRERRGRPLLDPRLFARPGFAMGTLSLTLQFFCFFGFIFVMLQYLQLVRGDSPWVAACSMIPIPLGLMPASRLSSALVPRLGQARLCGLGLGLLAAGLLPLSTLDAATPYWRVGIPLWVMGVGMGLAMPPATTAITESLPTASQGVASAINDLARELGGALGIATLGSILNDRYRSRLTESGLPDGLVARVRDSIAAADQLGPEALQAARGSFVDAVQLTMLVAAVVAGCAAALVAGILGHHSRTMARVAAAERDAAEHPSGASEDRRSR